MYTKILDRLLTGQSFTIDERERELGGSVFGIKEAFNTFSLVYHIFLDQQSWSIDFTVQLLLVRKFAVRITKHKIIRILQQHAVTG